MGRTHRENPQLSVAVFKVGLAMRFHGDGGGNRGGMLWEAGGCIPNRLGGHFFMFTACAKHNQLLITRNQIAAIG